MRLALLVLAAIFASISSAAPALPEKKDPAQKKSPAEGAPFVTNAWSKDGVILITRQATNLVNEVRTRQVVVDGIVTNVNVKVNVPVMEVTTIQLDPKTLEVKSADGKLVESADIPKLLKQKTKAIVSLSGKPVGDDLLTQNKNNVIIVVKPTK